MDSDLHRVVASSARLAEHTKRAYLRAVTSFTAAAGYAPTAWTPRRAQEWYQRELDRTSPATAAQAAYALRYASRRYAAEANAPDRDFARYIELQPIREKATRRALSASEARALLAVAPENNPPAMRDRALMALLLGTGMRRSGVTGIDLGHLGKNEVEIMLKGARKFTVPLAAPVMSYLRPWATWVKRHRPSADQPLFVMLKGVGTHATPGTRINGDALYTWVRRRGFKVGLDSLHPHILRHTFITLARQGGATVEEIAAVTGHYLPGHRSEIETTYVDRHALGAAATLKLPIWSTE